MPQHRWILLNMQAYTWKNKSKAKQNKKIWTKQNRALSMPGFWMCLMQYIAYGPCANYWAVIETETYSEHSQTFKMESFIIIIIMSECKCATRTFLWQEGGGGGVCGTRALLKDFVKCTRNRGPTGKHFGFFFS